MKIIQQGNYTLVRYEADRLDAAAAPFFRKTMHKKVSRSVRQGQPVILDLNGVEIIDDSGLGALLFVIYELQEKTKLLLCGVSKKISYIFKLARLDHILKPYQDVATILNMLQLA